ncbi:hypothetical protein SUGI_0770060 [Cryptomeria japonica]|nr:hypothetical protein SUGI_0770060 [Cryptomeria japonica]
MNLRREDGDSVYIFLVLGIWCPMHASGLPWLHYCNLLEVAWPCFDGLLWPGEYFKGGLVLGIRCPLHASGLPWPHCCSLLEAVWPCFVGSLWPSEDFKGGLVLCLPLVLAPLKAPRDWFPTFSGGFDS